MPVITELATMCKSVFVGGKVSYAYCTIPTYPRCDALPGPPPRRRHDRRAQLRESRVLFLVTSASTALLPDGEVGVELQVSKECRLRTRSCGGR